MGEVRNTVTGTFNLGVIVQGEHVVLQLPVQLTAAMAGLPAVESSFTGRGQNLEELLEVLAPHPVPAASAGGGAGGAVVVSAVGGMGGVGKTALGVLAARTALDRGWLAGGVLFVDMLGYDREEPRDVDGVVAGFLRAMAVPDEHIPADAGERLVLYRSVLEGYANSGRPVLVFIDNVSDTGQARRLLPGHPACRAIVTSRQRLARLDARQIDLDTLPADEAVHLMTNALRARLPGDTRLADDPQAAQELAGLCGGLPLALQIAAALLARNPHLTTAALADILRPAAQRLSELRDHQGTLAAVFDLSYQRLAADRQRLFTLLPVNPGPDISTSTAAALASLDATSARHALEDLADAHLIEPSPALPGGEQRWRLHDLLRLYAHHLPDNDADRAHALIRLLDHYQTTAQQATVHLEPPTSGDPASTAFPDRDSALAWLDAELDNLTAAITTEPTSDHHRELARDLPLTLVDYLAWRRHFNLWITLTITALHQAEHFGDLRAESIALNNLGGALQQVRRFEEAIDAHQQAGTICREIGDRRGEGSALNNLGLALADVWRFEEAIDAHQQVAIIFREIGDRRGEGVALGNLGSALRQVRRFEEAIDAHQQAATIFQETDDRHSEGVALNNLGSALRQVRRFEEAIDAHEQAAITFREIGDRHGEAGALNNLGGALQQVRRFEEAIDAHQQAATIFRETDDRHGEAKALGNLGSALATKVRRFEEAIDAHQQVAIIFREIGDRHSEGVALGNLGLTLWGMRRLEEAIDAYQQAAAIFREIGDRYHEGSALNNLGGALQEVRRFEEAIDAHEQDAQICRETDDRHGEGVALGNLGSALRQVRRFEEAIDAHQQAATIFQETDDRHSEGSALNNLGLTLRQVRRFEEAIDAHQQAATIFQETDDRHSEGVALNNLGSALRKRGRLIKARKAFVRARELLSEFDE
ncbi:hypothetical protein GCM10022221_22320 [Actinocorallia aurea]